MENYGLPDVERLLRSVIRGVFTAEFGCTWESDGLSSKSRSALSKNAERIRQKRASAELLSDWDLAGLPQLRDAVSNAMSRSENFRLRMATVWKSREEATVDLQRIEEYRDRALHGADPPLTGGEEHELESIVRRIRVGLERVRRSVADEINDFWPYIESISTNIEGWSYRRGHHDPVEARLVAGDLLEFRVSAIDPRGLKDEVVYVLGQSVDASINADMRLQRKSTITHHAPEGRLVFIFIGVRRREGPRGESVTFPAFVRPPLGGD